MLRQWSWFLEKKIHSSKCQYIIHVAYHEMPWLLMHQRNKYLDRMSQICVAGNSFRFAMVGYKRHRSLLSWDTSQGETRQTISLSPWWWNPLRVELVCKGEWILVLYDPPTRKSVSACSKNPLLVEEKIYLTYTINAIAPDGLTAQRTRVSAAVPLSCSCSIPNSALRMLKWHFTDTWN